MLGGDRRDFRLGSTATRVDSCRSGPGDHVILRPLAYRLYPTPSSSEEEVTYGFELACRQADEAHMRALLLQAMSRSSLILTALRSEDVEGTPKMKVTALIKSLGRHDECVGATGGEAVAGG